MTEYQRLTERGKELYLEVDAQLQHTLGYAGTRARPPSFLAHELYIAMALLERELADKLIRERDEARELAQERLDALQKAYGWHGTVECPKCCTVRGYDAGMQSVVCESCGEIIRT